ncbi:MAG: DUF1036 domain-containing protein [Asticcacaulis sp.]|uniref:DUF1036 domain-containing protein n=1 Tax=Asticcacaulis sp. TaxID=1872648 RepID=UPI0039E237DB
MNLSRFKTIALAICSVFCVCLLGAKPAAADAVLCNNTGYTISFAYRTGVGAVGSLYYQTDGWYTLYNGNCTKIMTGDASLAYHDIAAVMFTSPAQYFQATGETVYNYCVKSENFSYSGKPDYCPTGYYLAPFYRFDANTYNATFTLN